MFLKIPVEKLTTLTQLVSRKPYTYNIVYRPVYYVLYTELYTVLYTVLNTALCTLLCTLKYNKLYPDIKVPSELKCFLRNTSPLPYLVCRYQFMHHTKNYTVNSTVEYIVHCTVHFNVHCNV